MLFAAALTTAAAAPPAMPALARKILIVAAIDGLILSPIQNSRSANSNNTNNNTNNNIPKPVKIDWKSKQILPYAATASKDNKPKDDAPPVAAAPNGLEAHGIAGNSPRPTLSPPNSNHHHHQASSTSPPPPHSSSPSPRANKSPPSAAATPSTSSPTSP